MNTFKSLKTVIALTPLTIILCSCPQLRYKLFVRNLGSDTVQLTRLSKMNYISMAQTGFVRSKSKVIDINSETLDQLDQQIPALTNSNGTFISIPPKTTVFLNTLTYADSLMVITGANKTGTVKLNYRFKGFRRKADKNYVPRRKTLIYYDIR